MDQRDICVSVFRNGVPSKAEYTAKWATLINRLLSASRVLNSREEKL